MTQYRIWKNENRLLILENGVMKKLTYSYKWNSFDVSNEDLKNEEEVLNIPSGELFEIKDSSQNLHIFIHRTGNEWMPTDNVNIKNGIEMINKNPNKLKDLEKIYGFFWIQTLSRKNEKVNKTNATPSNEVEVLVYLGKKDAKY